MTTITSIDLNEVLKLEDVTLRDVNSVDTYIKELEWFKGLIDGHIGRCRYWQNNDQKQPGLGKLHEFLKQFEED